MAPSLLPLLLEEVTSVRETSAGCRVPLPGVLLHTALPVVVDKLIQYQEVKSPHLLTSSLLILPLLATSATPGFFRHSWLLLQGLSEVTAVRLHLAKCRAAWQQCNFSQVGTVTPTVWKKHKTYSVLSTSVEMFCPHPAGPGGAVLRHLQLPLSLHLSPGGGGQGAGATLPLYASGNCMVLYTLHTLYTRPLRQQ